MSSRGCRVVYGFHCFHFTQSTDETSNKVQTVYRGLCRFVLSSQPERLLYWQTGVEGFQGILLKYWALQFWGSWGGPFLGDVILLLHGISKDISLLFTPLHIYEPCSYYLLWRKKVLVIMWKIMVSKSSSLPTLSQCNWTTRHFNITLRTECSQPLEYKNIIQ